MNKKGKEVLERFGATNIEPYVLVSNYGYTYTLNGKNCDTRFWENCYGAYCGWWEGSNKEVDEAMNKEVGKSFDW